MRIICSRLSRLVISRLLAMFLGKSHNPVLLRRDACLIWCIFIHFYILKELQYYLPTVNKSKGGKSHWTQNVWKGKYSYWLFILFRKRCPKVISLYKSSLNFQVSDLNTYKSIYLDVHIFKSKNYLISRIACNMNLS